MSKISMSIQKARQIAGLEHRAYKKPAPLMVAQAMRLFLILQFFSNFYAHFETDVDLCFRHDRYALDVVPHQIVVVCFKVGFF